MYNRDKLRKFLGKATASPSPNSATDPSNPSSPSPANPNDPSASISSLPSVFRPTNAQNGVYGAGAPVACLDVATDRKVVVLGGPHILKTIYPDDPTSFDFKFKEGVDLRAHITALPSSGGRTGGSAAADQLNIRDVKIQGDSMVFTACANGKIFCYDITRLSKGDGELLEYTVIHEDSRQVNTLDLSPHRESWLLSGSQDGMVRMFDTAIKINNPRTGVEAFKQKYTPLRCNDPVRQVVWSPRNGYELACCTDAGIIMKWDIRTSARPLMRINAHEKACTTIAWHPDGVHLISGGADLKLHVWDLGDKADKRQKPKYTISTPAPVATAQWRPGLWSASAQSRRAAQVAVTYDDTGPRKYGNPVVHLWDLARPTMPYKEIERFESSPMALAWQNQDILWTVGKDGQFNQCDMAYAPNVIDRQSVSTMAFSPIGDVIAFLDQRPNRRSRPHFSHHIETPTGRYGTSPHAPMLSLSKSDSEEDIIGTFLGPKKRHHSRRASARSGQSLSTTPPSGPLPPDAAKQMMDLEQSIKSSGEFRLQQTMVSGHLPAAKTPEIYGYLSNVYLETIKRDLPEAEDTEKNLAERVLDIMEEFARAAELASLFRLAQTWRVLAFAMDLLLKQRAQYHLQWRLTRLQSIKEQSTLHPERRGLSGYKPGLGDGEATPRQDSKFLQTFDEKYSAGRAFVSDDIDSTSNIATPRARPVDHSEAVDIPDHGHHHGKRLSPIMEPESLTLGPAASGPFARESPRRRLDSAPISLASEESEPSTEGYDFYDTDALAHVVDLPVSSQESDAVDWAQENRRGSPRKTPAVPRENSGDSLGQMFSISAGTKQASMPKGSSFSSEAASKDSSGKGKSLRQSQRRTSNELPKAALSDSPEDIFMISQTTNGSDEVDTSQGSYQSHTDSELMSLTHRNSESPDLQPESSPVKSRPPPWVDTTPEIVGTDYLPWPEDPDYPFPEATKKPLPPPSTLHPKSPLDPYTLVKRALEFECKTSALNASAIILLLKPLLPDQVIDSNHASAILRQQHTRLTRMSLFVEATLLRQVCIAGWPAGIPDWGTSYAPVFTPAQKDVYVHFFCANCKKPKDEEINMHDESLWVCLNCKEVMAPCAVCGHRDPQLAAALPDDGMKITEEEWLVGWWHCPTCSHGGHASCLLIWHSAAGEDSDEDAYSGGCCPLDGCGHACLPGSYLEEKSTTRTEELARAALSRSSLEEHFNSAGSAPGTNPTTPIHSRPGSGRNSPRLSGRVMTDGNEVLQSRAVGMAREALNKGSAGPSSAAAAGGGILSSSPGRATGLGQRERRKSVKFVKPDNS